MPQATVDDYSDDELMHILQLDAGATDREVEARILQKKTANPDLASFFQDVYRRLFEVQDDHPDREEGFVSSTPEVLLDKSGTNNLTSKQRKEDVRDAKAALSLSVDELFSGVSAKGQQSTVLTKGLAYAKDPKHINPTFNDIIQRVLIIDSRCRDRTTYPSSSDFTINLTDNLRNVLGLNFYYVNIPYTWYTISKIYGANFFYLNGNAPGISDINHAIQFAIPPGNYTTPATLVAAINTSIAAVQSVRTDIQFGKSIVKVDSSTAGSGKATITWDIQNRFGDASYEVVFPYWTSPVDQSLTLLNGGGGTSVAQLSIPGFLGFLNNNVYPLASLYSDFDAAYVGGDVDLQNVLFHVTSSDNYFDIFNSPEQQQQQQQQDPPIRIAIPVGSFNINDLVILVTKSMKAHPQLNPQYSGLFFENANFSSTDHVQRFRLTVQLQRLTTSNAINSKQTVVFPPNGVWSQAFFFPDNNSPTSLNSTLAEIGSDKVYNDTGYYSSASWIYQVTDSPSLHFECTKSPENSLIITVPNNDFYTLDTHLQAINASIREQLPAANFVLTNDRLFYYDYYNTAVSAVQADFGFEKVNDIYTINVAKCILHTVFQLPATMTSNVMYTSTFPKAAFYRVDNTNRAFAISYPARKTLFLPFAPAKTATRTSAIPEGDWYVYRDLSSLANAFTTGKYGFANMKNQSAKYQQQQLQGTAIAEPIESSILLGGLSLAGTTLSFVETNHDDVTCHFMWKVESRLSELDYIVTLQGSSWADHLGFVNDRQTFALREWAPEASPVATIVASQDVTTSTINIYDRTIPNVFVQNNQLVLKPRVNADSLDPVRDSITLSIPAMAYNRYALIRALNAALDGNPVTAGSRFVWSGETVRIDWNINKVFTAQDYTLTFFDVYEFSSCTASTTNINTTSLTPTRWDETLGWLLGFRSNMSYNLSSGDAYSTTNAYSRRRHVVSLTADTPVNVNLYNQMHIVLDDFTSNHMNDGIVTISPPLVDIPSQSYANRADHRCQIVPLVRGTGLQSSPGIVNTNPSNSDAQGRVLPLLSQPQLYAAYANQQARTNKNSVAAKNFSAPPNVNHMFAIVPLKLSGLLVGQLYTEFGGTLQQNNRKYFGPVNISRIGIKLMSDRGDIVDLNNNDWSVGIVVDISVQPT